jgi:hypothetical protein
MSPRFYPVPSCDRNQSGLNARVRANFQDRAFEHWKKDLLQMARGYDGHFPARVRQQSEDRVEELALAFGSR